MFSAKELAPTEDQAVVFGVIQAAPNATLDQTNALRRAGLRRLRHVPREAERLPDHVAQRRLRRHGHEAVERAQEEHAAAPGRGRDEACRKIPGIRVISLVPPALPGGGSFPVDFVIASTAEPERLDGVRQPARRQGVRERRLHVRRLGPQVRPAAGRGRLRPRQAALAGRGPRHRPAATSRRCSAATTSTASRSRAAATRSSRRSSARSGSTPTSSRTSTSRAPAASSCRSRRSPR